MKSGLQRNEEAVSAAVATVLMFGGVLSIIGMMMVSMIPVIEELEGSVERHDMSAQMSLLAHQTSALSEKGMPGDSTSIDLIPVDGSLEWQHMKSGMWYAATWHEDMSFRMRGALDFDDELEVRHPESVNTALCIDDLRLGPSNPYYYTIPEWVDKVRFTVAPGLAIPLGPVDVDLVVDEEIEQTIELMVDGMHELEANELGLFTLASSHELNVFIERGTGGTTLVAPNDASPIDNTGRSWSVPLPAGTSKIHLISDDANQISITNESTTQTHYALPSGQNRVGVAFTKTIVQASPGVIHISSSDASRLLVQTSIDADQGIVSLPSTDGQYLGHAFIAPYLDGEMVFTNPGTSSVTVTWRGGGISVAPNQSLGFAWPPAGVNGAPLVEAEGDVFVTWRSASTGEGANTSGLFIHPADDTGASSGQHHTFHVENSTLSQSAHLMRAGQTVVWNLTGAMMQNGSMFEQNGHSPFDLLNLTEGTSSLMVTEGHTLRATRINGNDGLHQIRHDGEDRCLSIGVEASGWIAMTLPWTSMSGRGEVDLKNAWRAGTHPSSMEITLIGGQGTSTHATIGTVWGFHLSRLAYGFSSSIMGMEVAYSGGAVLTNHPEFESFVVVAPSDRGGPGPRFAATVPALHPTAGSTTGAGSMNLEIELVDRSSLASTVAHEIRRGWSEPYGTAIALASADGLESSEDWTVYPGRIDLLTDYVGWVPDPSYGTSEAVWHTNGEPIQFTLQMSSLNVHMTEAIS